MNLFRTTRRAGLRLLALAGLLGAAAAHASGGYEPEDLFFATNRPDQPVREFVERPAGYYTSYLVPYQVLWYWRLHGQPFSPEAVRVFSELLEKLPREDGGMDEIDKASAEWQKARGNAYARLGHPLADAGSGAAPSQQAPQWNADSLHASPNCFYGDAFRSATKTLAQRMERAAADKAAAPYVLHWLQTQDAVFGACDEKAAPSPALPAGAPAWLKSDNAYQQAAQRFYAGDLDGADAAFEEIAADRSSAWRDLSAYMRLRVLARRHPGAEPSARENAGAESAEALKQQAELTREVDALAQPLLKNPRLQALHPSVHRLAEALRIRYLSPGTRVQRLADGLAAMGPPDVAAARLLLLNHEFRNCAFMGCPYIGPRHSSDLVQWLSVVRNFGSQGDDATPSGKWRETLSWDKYQRTRDLAWLMAAASLVPAPAGSAGDARETELQAALAAVPENHPARFAATQLRAQRLFARGRYQEARSIVADAAGSPLIAHSLSGQNLVKALLLPTAATEEEWRRLAVRPVVARRDPEALEARPASPPAGRPWLATALDDDVIRFINMRAPLPMWLRLAADPGLSPALRDALLETAWTRAVLAGDHALARRAAALRIANAPPAPAKGTDPIAGLRRSAVLPDTDADAWRRLLLERMASTTEVLASPHWPGAGWSVRPAPLLPGREPNEDTSPSINSYAKWCRPLGAEAAGAADLEPPSFLPKDEREQHAALARKLRAMPPDSVYFTQESLALMQRNRNDPLVPQALSVSVKMARYTCQDKTVGDWSRKGLQALHASYPKSAWAAGTLYWYGGR